MNRRIFFLITSTLISCLFAATARSASLGNHLDASFSGDGKTTRRVGGNLDGATDVAVQPDGKIITIGSIVGTGSRDFLVVRYNSDGGIDTSFGDGGSVITDFGGGTDQPRAIVLQADGKIVVGGFGSLGPGSYFNLVRYNADGSLDTGFGNGGKTIASFGESSSLRGLAIQADGKIVGVGGATTVGQTTFALVRYNTNGVLDTSFSFDGQVTTSTGGYADAVVIQPDGKIIAAGGTGQFELVRYHTDGSLDTNFHGDGKVETPIGDSVNGSGIALQSDGKIVVTGGGLLNSQAILAVARYDIHGVLDPSFSGDGKVFFSPEPTTQNQFGRDVVIQPDGKIVTIGRVFGDIALIRFLGNGNVDETFGNAGLIRTDLGSDVLDQAAAIAVAPNNKLVVTAHTEISGTPGFGIARYTTNLSVPRPTADFDGDGVSDLAVFRPSNGAWYVFNSYSNTYSVFGFGLPGDIPIDGDFNGDDRNDYAVFRPSTGVWYISQTSNNQFNALQFGISGDKPVAGDYDHDGKTDVAVWRPADGNFYVFRSSDGQASVMHWGASGDIPIASAVTP